MLKYEILPEGLRSGMKLYVEQGILPGGFLTAVLENNLSGAFQRADSRNLPRLQSIVEWCYWELPSPAWGSTGAVAAWIKKVRTEGEEE